MYKVAANQELTMGIHHDYKSKRGERAMAKQQKREAKFNDNTDKKEEEKRDRQRKKKPFNRKAKLTWAQYKKLNLNV